MPDTLLPPGKRQERIERILQELRYELQQGVYDGDITENFGDSWFVNDPTTRNHVWHADFSFIRQQQPATFRPLQLEGHLHVVRPCESGDPQTFSRSFPDLLSKSGN